MIKFPEDIEYFDGSAAMLAHYTNDGEPAFRPAKLAVTVNGRLVGGYTSRKRGLKAFRGYCCGLADRLPRSVGYHLLDLGPGRENAWFDRQESGRLEFYPGGGGEGTIVLEPIA